ncbi:MoaD/ThiS family protein [Galbibacter sp.]|uniref:MoaD/ThiS family protein n=1 Tax=Galbibacter sp. TaxID=2918471 RepID=UPI002B826CAA|nr:MoaD/ThiS family protein [Galbibacter sp.]HLV62618.1 MoaD/ThiS family protein [Galbibacter sp.]
MQVLLFGITKEIINQDVLIIPTSENIKDVGELKAYLKQKYPDLSRLSSLGVAVNSVYAKEDVLIGSSDELALIPPVSGG